MSVAEEYLKDIKNKIDLIQCKILKEDIDGIFAEDLMELQVYIQCLLKLCRHKDNLENTYSTIISKAFYLLLQELNKEELKMVYGLENLGITYQEFIMKFRNKEFTELEIMVLIKDFIK